MSQLSTANSVSICWDRSPVSRSRGTPGSGFCLHRFYQERDMRGGTAYHSLRSRIWRFMEITMKIFPASHCHRYSVLAWQRFNYSIEKPSSCREFTSPVIITHLSWRAGGGRRGSNLKIWKFPWSTDISLHPPKTGILGRTLINQRLIPPSPPWSSVWSSWKCKWGPALNLESSSVRTGRVGQGTFLTLLACNCFH